MTVTECEVSVEELLERAAKPGVEAMLSGTAAVLTSVGTLIHNGEDVKVGNGEIGPMANKLRQALNDIQWGKAPDNHNWLTKIA
jgi:branched-chain amino acid aminotransferase